MIRSLIRRLAGPLPTTHPSAEDLLALTTAEGHPNVNALWQVTKDIDALKLNTKMLAYELAHSMEHRLQGIPVDGPRTVGLDSKPVTQADIETRWFRSWCEQLGERPRYHRSLWQYAYILQAFYEGRALQPGSVLCGIGAGEQALPSYLAGQGLDVVIDGGPEPRHLERLVDRGGFLSRISYRAADCSPVGQGRYDACWSISHLSHSGSIAKGAALVLRSLEALKPGGTAVHILEFNYADDDRTIDNWELVLFQRRHIEALAQELQQAGHAVAPLNFHVGHQPLDRYVDLPPFGADRTEAFDRLWRDGWQSAHLKVSIDGFACTSFGLIVKKSR